VVTAAGLAYRRPRRAGNAVVSGAAAALATPTPRPPQQLPAAPPSVAPRRPAPERCAENAALTAAACYAARDYARAAELAAGEVEARGGDVERWIVLVRALANQGRLADAARACAVALERHRTAAELHYLHAVLLERARRPEQAEAAARRALYLDRSLGVAHLLLGGVLAAQGDRDGARRALAAAERTYAALDPAQVPPAADRETAGRLAGMARAGLRLLEAAP
jgi:chemotaxis protein methyltransferase CheR